jgi:hypothetical protein
MITDFPSGSNSNIKRHGPRHRCGKIPVIVTGKGVAVFIFGRAWH